MFPLSLVSYKGWLIKKDWMKVEILYREIRKCVKLKGVNLSPRSVVWFILLEKVS